LFCTQNPATGKFKGKREPLSSSFLDRFSLIQFSELSQTEWVEVALHRLKSLNIHAITNAKLAQIADRLVMVHMEMKRCIAEKSPEAASPYAEVS
jgi:midasin (ATPase involved in ribosome maturation)